jgi:hypothetical protein
LVSSLIGRVRAGWITQDNRVKHTPLTQVLLVPDLKGRAERVAWDGVDPSVFFVAEGGQVLSYVFHHVSMSGACVVFVVFYVFYCVCL